MRGMCRLRGMCCLRKTLQGAALVSGMSEKTKMEESDMKPYAFGIDIGGTTVKCGFFNGDGTFVEKWEIETRKEMSIFI